VWNILFFSRRVISKKGPHSLQQFEKVMQVNTVGTFNCIRLISESMSQHCIADNDGMRGVIINTASIAAMDGQIGQAAYAASKGAIISMVRSICTIVILLTLHAGGFCSSY
jgi:NAD(P)-dependent dehydrogenase (short-subunit alcohol dehydrogenase family)